LSSDTGYDDDDEKGDGVTYKEDKFKERRVNKDGDLEFGD